MATDESLWSIAVLKVAPYDLRSVNVEERVQVDLDELRAKEAARLEAMAAKAMVTRMLNKKNGGPRERVPQ